MSVTRLVWMVLNDGRSVIAGCGSATRDALITAIAEPDRMLTLTSDDSVEHIPTTSVRDFTLYEAKSKIPAATSIYRLVHV
jgi:hypothetical protein